MIININTNSIVHLTNILEKMHKSALPVAIRTSLNSAAFDVKKTTMPQEAQSTFLKRQKNFFKANSRVEMAQGFSINKMQASVGFFENKLNNKSTNYAVKDLEQQEHGGKITNKTFIPMRNARVGGSGITKAANRLSSMTNKIINSNKVNSIHGRNKKQKLIRAAIIAKKTGGNNAMVMGPEKSNGSQTLFRVDRLNISKSTYTFAGGGKTLRGSKLDIKLTPLFQVKKGRTITVQKTDFMQHASITSHKKLEHFYITNATKQINKYAGKL